MNKEIYLSVIIPAYNEEERLIPTMEKVLKYLIPQPYTWEIVVVDDGSRDKTYALARDFEKNSGGRIRALTNGQNKGKGESIKHGMLEAKGYLRLFSDADLSTPIEELEKLMKAIDDGYDVAIGSRALRESQVELHQPWYRETMGRIFNLMVQALVLPGLKDTQCGFKILTEKAAMDIFPKQRFKGFSFDVEMLYLARKSGFKIREIPVRWINSPASRVHPIRDASKMFIDIVRLRLGI